MRDNRHFQRRSAVYTCLICEKRTRETGYGESNVELCAYCFELTGLENSFSDGAITEEQFNSELKQLKLQFGRE